MADLSDLPRVHPHSIEKIAMSTISLDDGGLIRDCSADCESLFGYKQAELVGQHVSLLLPQLHGVDLVKGGEINPRLKYLCHCAIPFQVRRRDGHNFAGEVFFNRLNSGEPGLQVIVRNLLGTLSR
jgi:PAS domain S-box-containing protein